MFEHVNNVTPGADSTQDRPVEWSPLNTLLAMVSLNVKLGSHVDQGPDRVSVPGQDGIVECSPLVSVLIH